ncbi:AmiB activator [Clavibacter michiganensis subsp. michiganensis]|uniref:AmiB activator n=1 Tax=Clavibacter michiganensis subsp. michiganensis TaxID=33013 RepID=A0A251XGB4_CLAMM|nr:AmiB activator [Clavibacter michiganensis subsp. michiganensis]OUE00943.1 AmiB activator [Clavibacter michiganensis subsp. michiganensis]
MLAACALLLGLGVPSAQAAEEYPTWSEVQAARSSEQATADQVTRITSLISGLSAEVEAATALALQRADEHAAAVDALDEATGELQALESKAERAQADADEAKRQVGQLVAQLARSGGGGDVSLRLFTSGGEDADALLARMGTATKLADRQDTAFTAAVTSARTAASLGKQASVAKEALAVLAADAEAKLQEASAAQARADQALAEQEARSSELQAQLTTLRDSRISVEEGFAIGERKRQEEAAAEARRQADARAAAAAAAAARERRRATAGQRPPPAVLGGQPSSSGWTMPIRSYGSYQSYGMRLHPILGYWRLHAGDDFGAGCGTPIYATAAGTVQFAGGSSGFGNAITLNHGGGVTSVYGHMYSYGVMVRTGQTVQAASRSARSAARASAPAATSTSRSGRAASRPRPCRSSATAASDPPTTRGASMTGGATHDGAHAARRAGRGPAGDLRAVRRPARGPPGHGLPA